MQIAPQIFSVLYLSHRRMRAICLKNQDYTTQLRVVRTLPHRALSKDKIYERDGLHHLPCYNLFYRRWLLGVEFTRHASQFIGCVSACVVEMKRCEALERTYPQGDPIAAPHIAPMEEMLETLENLITGERSCMPLCCPILNS